MTNKQKENLVFKPSKGGKRASKRRNRINVMFFKYLVFTLLIACGTYYIIGINDLSIRGFVINNLNSQIYSLENDNDFLEDKIMDLESFSSLDERIEELKMVKVDKIDYLNISEEVVAVK